MASASCPRATQAADRLREQRAPLLLRLLLSLLRPLRLAGLSHATKPRSVRRRLVAAIDSGDLHLIRGSHATIHVSRYGHSVTGKTMKTDARASPTSRLFRTSLRSANGSPWAKCLKKVEKIAG